MRPRQFDDETVFQIAFDQFWRKGVRATSLSDIARDVGVQRGSLYNAYGSKEALFLRAYAHYADDYLAKIAQALSAGPLRTRLARFFDVAIQNFCAGAPPRGCPTTRGLMELASIQGDGLDEDARQAFADLLTRLANLLTDAFRDGAAKGEFRGDPAAAADHILTVARGLVVLERAFRDEARLHRIAASAIDAIAPSPEAAAHWSDGRA